MNSSLWRLPAVALFFIVLISLLGCKGLWSSPPPVSLAQKPLRPDLPGIYSNAGGQEVAAAFALQARAVIKHVTWYGFWTDNRWPGTNATTTFNLSLFPDASGAPGEARIANQSVTAKLQTSGQTLNQPGDKFLNGRIIYRFDADISPAISIAAGTNWLSISAPHPTSVQWLWARSAMGPSELQFRVLSRGQHWDSYTGQGQTAFAIDGVVVP
ncbi:MAG: hypothetical protein WCS42_25405 [Verrucomicrobiota bacterium]